MTINRPLATVLNKYPSGILVVGGRPFSMSPEAASVHFWSATSPEEKSRVLNDFPRQTWYGPTANLVDDQVVTCYEDSCRVLKDGAWEHLAETRVARRHHSSTVYKGRVLLIGGEDTLSTEWISLDGSPSEAGPFQLTGNHGKGHCTIKVSPDVIVVTGGWNGKIPSWTSRSYNLGTGAETNVGKMFVRRYMHACGVYEDASHRQVRTVSFLFLLRPK